MRCKICWAGTPGQKHGQRECGCLQAATTTVPHVCHQECAGALPGQMRVGDTGKARKTFILWRWECVISVPEEGGWPWGAESPHPQVKF